MCLLYVSSYWNKIKLPYTGLASFQWSGSEAQINKLYWRDQYVVGLFHFAFLLINSRLLCDKNIFFLLDQV